MFLMLRIKRDYLLDDDDDDTTNENLLVEFVVLIQASKASSLPGNGAKNLTEKILNSLL